MEYLTDGLRELRGIEVFKTPDYIERTYWGGYQLKFKSEELNNLAIEDFINALRAEGIEVNLLGENWRAAGFHLKPIMQEDDIYGKGCPWSCPHLKRRIKYKEGNFPVTERECWRILSLPIFHRGDKELINQYITAFKKVINHYSKTKEKGGDG